MICLSCLIKYFSNTYLKYYNNSYYCCECHLRITPCGMLLYKYSEYKINIILIASITHSFEYSYINNEKLL